MRCFAQYVCVPLWLITGWGRLHGLVKNMSGNVAHIVHEWLKNKAHSKPDAYQILLYKNSDPRVRTPPAFCAARTCFDLKITIFARINQIAEAWRRRSSTECTRPKLNENREVDGGAGGSRLRVADRYFNVCALRTYVHEIPIEAIFNNSFGTARGGREWVEQSRTAEQSPSQSKQETCTELSIKPICRNTNCRFSRSAFAEWSHRVAAARWCSVTHTHTHTHTYSRTDSTQIALSSSRGDSMAEDFHRRRSGVPKPCIRKLLLCTNQISLIGLCF